jgi:2-polyprenyl-3-methyl-5-hydroxy-6-metoxy-1,4-benzoquinol methylase
MNDEQEIRYEKYYSTVFSKTKLKGPEQTFDFYNRCFTWCLPSKKQDKILDFGAGLGNLTAWLHNKGYQNTVSVDLSREQCIKAKEICNVTVEHISNPYEYLCSQESTFDAIFMSDVIEHIPKTELISTLTALKKCLKPGGFISIKTDNVSTPTGIYHHHFDFTHEYTFVERSLSQLLKICDFEKVEIRGHSMAWPKRPWNWWKPVVRWMYIGLLKIVYEAEQPRGDNNPQIFSVNLIARAYRPRA